MVSKSSPIITPEIHYFLLLMANTRTRSWCFTLNNPTTLIILDEDKVNKEKIGYLVYQKEIGKKGTPHLQGHVYFANPKTMAGVKKSLRQLYEGENFEALHLERCKGTSQENKDYCTKEDTRLEGPFEIGTCPKQGARTDLEEIKTLIDSGAKDADVAEQYFGQYIRYHGGFRKYRSVTARKRDWKTKVVVHYGSTGLGKTYRAQTLGKKDEGGFFERDCDDKWWAGYEGESTVLVDEFDGSIISANRFKQLGDRGACTVQVKGENINWAARTLYITSNTVPGEWWPNLASVHFEAIVRRVDEWWHFTPLATRRFGTEEGEEDEDGQKRYGRFLDSLAAGSRSEAREYERVDWEMEI